MQEHSKSESEDKLREVHNIGGKENVTSILKHKDQQHHRLVRFTSIPGKMIVQLILGIISRNMKYKSDQKPAGIYQREVILYQSNNLL